MKIYTTKKNQGEVSGTLNTETFTGSGNSPEDARENAFTRYKSWRFLQRQAGKNVDEKGTEYTYSQRNEVHCRCVLKVEYTLL